jgi:phosphoribosyl-AMP cyclohydrolase
MMPDTDLIDWTAWPLIPAVVQDPESLQVLMVGFMNREALEKTMSSGLVTFYSRSRETLWTKGETSGNLLHVVELRINCEENSLLIAAHPAGPTCHTGYPSCYFRRIEADGSLTIVLERPDDSGSSSIDPRSDAELTRRWYGAYEFLRDHDLSDVSGTSKRLHDPSFPFADRIADELEELAGVFDGTHSHQGLIGDILLEGTQVAYWTASLAVQANLTWEQLRPDAGLSHAKSLESPAAASDALRRQAAAWRMHDNQSAIPVEPCREVIQLVASACLMAGVDPFELVQRDLREQQDRDYLEPYFNG